MNFPRMELPFGYVEPFGDNEILIVSNIPDPPKIRQACPFGSIGAWSFCMLREDGYPEELVLFQGKLDERERHTGRKAGECTMHILAPEGASEDARMVRIYEMRHDKVVFDVPVAFRAGIV
jgi:hypothetical protein